MSPCDALNQIIAKSYLPLKYFGKSTKQNKTNKQKNTFKNKTKADSIEVTSCRFTVSYVPDDFLVRHNRFLDPLLEILYIYIYI